MNVYDVENKSKDATIVPLSNEIIESKTISNLDDPNNPQTFSSWFSEMIDNLIPEKTKNFLIY